ncbi:MAG: hypothetical protein L0Y58_22375 [Verrucomicrobia subdivision 3 bacterium]|nr:hypothetical protein [Limisphaerales bacterium]
MQTGQAQIQTAESFFDGMNEQMQAYEIVSAEDRRTRYFFFAGDAGDVPGPGGMRVQTRCVPKKTLYRCLVTPVVTVRQLELTNLIPTGAVIPGSENRVKAGCSEYWVFAGPEAMTMLSDYGNGTDPTRHWGLVEVAPDLLRGLDWEKEVKPLKIQDVFFPEWPRIPETNRAVGAHLEARIEEIEKTDEPLIAGNRDLYRTIGADMLRAVEAAQTYQEWVCAGSNQGVAEPRGSETHKRGFDARDEACFKRSEMIKNTQALQRVAEEMKLGVKAASGGLSEDALQRILATVVPANQPAFTPEMLGAAIAHAMKLMNEQQAVSVEDRPKPAVRQSQQKNADSK